MATQALSIPVLDCNAIGLNLKEENISNEALKTFGEQFVSAFASHGVCYLKNYGVDKDFVDQFMAVCRKFYTLPDEVKGRNKRVDGTNFGWFGVEGDTICLERPADLKEAFNYCPGEEEDESDWPDKEFERYNKKMFETCEQLTKRLLDSLSLGLGLEKSFMANAHKAIGNKGSQTTLRTLFYPPILDQSSIKPGQVRLGEHTDYGTISLLLQDGIGGLETDIPGKGFVPVTPIPNTLVVLPAGLLQRWTTDAVKATIHRVLIPQLEVQQRTYRQSLVFFVQPDDDFLIEPLDGSDKYKPVTSMEYLIARFSGTGFQY